MSEIWSQMWPRSQACQRLFMHLRVQKFMFSMQLHGTAEWWQFQSSPGGDLCEVPKFGHLDPVLGVREWSEWSEKFRKVVQW